jgi:hypothetical protein
VRHCRRSTEQSNGARLYLESVWFVLWLICYTTNAVPMYCLVAWCATSGAPVLCNATLQRLSQNDHDRLYT